MAPRSLLALAISSLALLPFAAGAPATKAIVGGTLIDPASGRVIEDSVIVIEGDRISAAGPGKEVKIPAAAERVDARGRWIIPGLIDTHVHFFQSGGLYTRPDGCDLRAVRPYPEEIAGIKKNLPDTFKRWLRSGVTSVVDVGGPFWNFDMRDQARATKAAPRVAVAGPLISSVSREALDLGDPPILEIKTPEEARALVRRLVERKPDFVKIWYIRRTPEDVENFRPIVRATIEESHAHKVASLSMPRNSRPPGLPSRKALKYSFTW